MTRKLQIGTSSPGTKVCNVFDVVGVLWKAPEPLSVKEVSSVTGIHRNTLDRYFFLLKEEGLIVPAGKRRGTILYRWAART